MKSSTKTLICVDKRDLTEQIALSLAAVLDVKKYSIGSIAIKMVGEIEQMANRKGH